MQTRLEFNDKIQTCIIYFAEDMCDAETRDALAELKKFAKTKRCDKFIAVIPKKFDSCEDFRMQVHRYIVAMRKQNPKFKIAVVTTLLKVIGYEQFATFVTQMVDRQQIFDNIDKAITWISK